MFLNCDLKSFKFYNKPKSSNFLFNQSSYQKLNKMTSNLEHSNSDLVLHKSTSSLEKLDDNFCGAFQEHYEYLMDEGLIETCQHTGNQKSDITDDLSVNVSYKEFLHQYNQIKNWLDQLKIFRPATKSTSSYCEKYTNQIFYEEILKRSPRRELLNEYACHLIKYHPNLKHDVLSKLHYLNKQWKSIESIISKNYFNQDIAKDLEEDLKNFELWLSNVEKLVENLAINPNWSLTDIETTLNEHKCLQYDIESHAKIINSVLKLSSKLKQAYVDYLKFYENGLYLQNKWHCLWLKSLEWQCRLEQEINRLKKATLSSEEQIEYIKTNNRDVSNSNKNQKFQEIINKVPIKRKNSRENFTESNSDDVIPFDESEYEKILTTSSTGTTLNINLKKKIRFYLLHSRSLTNLNKPKYQEIHNLRKTMSFSNLFTDFDPKPKIPTSLTESEISKRFDVFDKRKKRRFLNPITNDLSYYYSLTDVKYYSLDDDEDDLSDKSKSNSSSISNFSKNSKIQNSSSSSISSLDLSYKKYKHNFNKTNRSLSEYNIIKPKFKKFRRYSARKISDLNETGGNDADLDDNLDDLNSDEYDYDNSHELIEYDDRPIVYPYIENFKNKLKLNMTVTSAYDTCSNLSNEANSLSSSEKVCRAKSGRSSSGNASGDFNDDYSNQIQIISFTESSNFDNYDSKEVLNEIDQVTTESKPIEVNSQTIKVDSNSNETKTNETTMMYPTNNNEHIINTAVDETSTTNTDISDPHWDGYTSSPFYSNSVTVEDVCLNEKTQPILPWDELFFELDPIEDIPKKQNTNHYTTPKQRLRFTRRASACVYQTNGNLNQKFNNQSTNNNHSHHHYYYHHHHHHYDNQKKLKSNSRSIKLTDKKDSLSSCEYSESSIETTTSDFKNDFTNNPNLIYRRRLSQQIKMFEDEFVELDNIINDSLEQLNHVTNLNCFKKFNFTKQESYSSLDSTKSRESNFSFYNCTSNTFIQQSNSSNFNYIPKYSDLLAICHTNISNLKLIKNLIKANLRKESAADNSNPHLFTYQYEFKENQQLLQFKQQKLDYYLVKLEDTINKWEMLETKLSEAKSLDEAIGELLAELKTLKNSVEFIQNSTKLDPNVLYFSSIDNLQNIISQFEEKSFLLTDILNKLNEQNKLYTNFVNSEKEVLQLDPSVQSYFDQVKNELDSIEEIHKQTSLDLKIKKKKLENLLKNWCQVEDIKNLIDNQIKKYDSELIYDCSINCTQSSSFLNETAREETLNKNLNNRNLLDLLNQSDLDRIESNLTIFETNLNLFRRELFDLFKFKSETVTVTDLESIVSKYSLYLDQFKNKFNYLKELLSYKNRTQIELENSVMSKHSSIIQKIDLINSNKIKTNTNFNLNDQNDILTNIHLDFQIDDHQTSHFSNLKTSTPRYRHIEIENTIQPKLGGRRLNYKSEEKLSDKSIQTDVLETKSKIKNNKNLKSTDSGIVMSSFDSTDMGSCASSTPFSSSLVKTESSTENISSHKTKELEKVSELSPLVIESNFIKKRKMELERKIDEIEVIKPVENLEELAEEKIEDLEREIEEETRPKTKMSFVKILFYSLFLSLIFVFFMYYIMPKVMPKCCDFKRDYLWFNVMTFFNDDEDRLVPF